MKGEKFSKPDFADIFVFQSLCVAVACESHQIVAFFAVQDSIDGGLARDVFYLVLLNSDF